MSRILIVLCHPREGSFNHALAERLRAAAAAANHEVVFRDLYRERFDPVLSAGELARKFSFDEGIQGHYRDLSGADGIVIVHPDWWGQPPALLKGWVDRVFRQGIAYDFEGEEFVRKRKVPLLSGKRALVFCTSDASPSKHPLTELWRNRIFGYCGAEAVVKVFPRFREAKPAERAAWIDEAERLFSAEFSPGEQ